MCGIAGILAYGEDAKPTDPADLGRMADALAHRGPDGAGSFLERGLSSDIGLAHRRLAITEKGEGAAQPFHHLDRYVLVFNGEVYNHAELRRELEAQGVVFRTRSDTEVVAAAYHAFGADCVHRFDGMFAFAVWDRALGRLFCARDRFGEKPFHYHFDAAGRRFIFASEMKALWAAGIPRRPRPSSFLHFLTLGLTEHPQLPELTFYEDVFRLPPAHRLTLDSRSGTCTLEAYWDLDRTTVVDIGPQEAVDGFRTLFEAAVASRLSGAEPAANMLSGGVDSACMAAACAAAIDAPQLRTAFSAVFPGFERDESSRIRRLVAVLGWRGVEVLPDAGGLLQALPDICRHQEEPFGSAGVYAQFAVHAAARSRGVRVLMDGQGADELLGGYPRHPKWHLQALIAAGRFRRAAREARAFTGHGLLEGWSWRNWPAALGPALAAARLEARARGRHWSDDAVDPRFREAHSGAGYIQRHAVHSLNDALYGEACGGPLQTLLRYADRNAMAHGIEARMPFLSHRLAEFVFALPPSVRMRQGFTKWVLRECYRERIPEDILYARGKTGFEPPQQAWMSDPAVQAAIRGARGRLVDAGMLHPRVLRRAVAPTPAYARDNADWRHWIASMYL